MANLEGFCKWWFHETGECIPGFNRLEIAPVDPQPTVRLVVKEQVIVDRLRETAQLEGVGRFLLGGDAE